MRCSGSPLPRSHAVLLVGIVLLPGLARAQYATPAPTGWSTPSCPPGTTLSQQAVPATVVIPACVPTSVSGGVSGGVSGAPAEAIPPAPQAPPYYLPPAQTPPGWASPSPLALPPQQLVYEGRTRWGLFAAGTSIFGGVWLTSAAAGYLSGQGRLAVPLLGPWLLIGKLRGQNVYCAEPAEDYRGDYVGGCSHYSDPGDRLAYGLLAFNGVLQAGGVVMALTGLLTQKRVAVYRSASTSVSLLPSTGLGSGGSVGLAAVGHF